MIDETRIRIRLAWLWVVLSVALDRVYAALVILAKLVLVAIELLVRVQGWVDRYTDEAMGMGKAAVECMEREG